MSPIYTQIRAVAYLVEALCYKPEGRGFDSRSGHWIFKDQETEKAAKVQQRAVEP
jgi:hypothetical protein